MWSYLHIQANLNSIHYIREALQPEVLLLLQATVLSTFQQTICGENCASLLWRKTIILTWPACSSDMSPIEHAWDMVSCQLVVMVLQQPLSKLYELTYKLWGGRFPRNILWCYAMLCRGSDCSTWRFDIIFKSHGHKSCTVL